MVRSDPSETVVAGIYVRDRFHCRYCGARVIATLIMRLLAALFPDDFPYDPDRKGRGADRSGDRLPRRDP